MARLNHFKFQRSQTCILPFSHVSSTLSYSIPLSSSLTLSLDLSSALSCSATLSHSLTPLSHCPLPLPLSQALSWTPMLYLHYFPSLSCSFIFSSALSLLFSRGLLWSLVFSPILISSLLPSTALFFFLPVLQNRKSKQRVVKIMRGKLGLI